MTPDSENSFLQEIEQKTLQDLSNADLINATAFELQDQAFLAILSRLAVHLCKRNLDLIKGRVLVQTSPSAAYKLQETLDHARLYASEFERPGIPNDRYCIKIMATGPGLNAAKILQEEGISTLGTGVFSVVQAVACSQAGCLYISPYYNEIRTHLNPELWPDVQDPALEHPFSHRIAQMVQAYKTLFATTGKEQPLIKNAGFRSYKEVLASAELGCHSANISQDLLEELKT
ncbi:transaldolase [Fusarium napiforme]|uniref:Transaldolase n=1 Tax=Fusarium napiforme TaxID=42672 RepID=A0A8H5JY36_9HYPO|nr:transaldolase [Fusarium napiforme]